MAVVDVLNQTGEKIAQAELSDSCFNVDVKPSVLHTVVKMQLANRRAGTVSVKNRSDVKGSTRKLFRQKGPAVPGGVMPSRPCCAVAELHSDPIPNHGRLKCLKRFVVWR
jgi:ribosomal protein L4